MFSSVSVQHSKRSHGRSRCKGVFACVLLEVSIRNKTTFTSHCSNTFVFQLKYHMRRNRPISLEFSISRVSPLKCSNFKELHDLLSHSSFPKPSILAPYRLAPRCRLIDFQLLLRKSLRLRVNARYSPPNSVRFTMFVTSGRRLRISWRI